MKNHTDKFLLGFLGFGIFLYLLSMFYGGDPSSDFSGNSSNADPDTSILDTSTVLPLADTMETASDTSIISPLADTMAVLEGGNISWKSIHQRQSFRYFESSSLLADTMACITKENISRKLYTKRRDRDALEAARAS